MGLYINPTGCTKEQWLQENGVLFAPTLTGYWHIIETVFKPESDALLVCLVDNGPFKAAAVAYDESELEAFNQPDDYRPKVWYVVKKADIKAVCPDAVDYLK